jgi:hypothetical protein
MPIPPETLKTHADRDQYAYRHLWGTIGGFVPTKELTGELFVRWFR